MNSSSAPRRIVVANFDPAEQTRVWLALGADQATRAMLGALRTALIVADTVVVDRNQLLEGIFFIKMTPDRLAWHLGYPPGEALPITVGLLNPGPGRELALEAPGPWTGSAGPSWARSDDEVHEIDRNYEAVAADKDRVSAPLQALTARYDGSGPAGAPSVAAPAPSKQWCADSNEALTSGDVWSRRDDVLARSLIDEGRAAWITAMKTGRVVLAPRPDQVPDMGLALERAQGHAHPEGILVSALRDLEQPKPDARLCEVNHSWSQGRGTSCGRQHVTQRSLLVRWLDGETVPALAPPTMSEELRSSTDHAERVAAFHWWTATYYDAICTRDDLSLLTLHHVVGSEDSSQSGSWGVRSGVQRARSRLSLLRSRLSRQAVASGKELEIEGEIVQNLMEFSPGQFTQLVGYKFVQPGQLWSSQPRRQMFELALAVREIAGERVSRIDQLWSSLGRVAILGALAVAFALRDAGVLPERGGFWIVAGWLVLAIGAAFPWSEFKSVLRMSGSELQSTVRIRGRS